MPSWGIRRAALVADGSALLPARNILVTCAGSIA
jgi:hypothetical protein